MCDLTTLDILTTALAQWDMELDDLQRHRYQRYAEMLVEWNANRANLTRLTSPEQIAIQHFVDSIALFKVTQLARGASILDIGSGAGFPGLALKIFRPDLTITLLEAGLKKVKFCEAVCDELDLSGVTAIHGRAEAFPRAGRAAGYHDLVTARGVTALDTLLQYAYPYLVPGTGRFVAWKGPAAASEMAAAEKTKFKLRLRMNLTTLALPGLSEPRIHSYIVCTQRTT